MSDRIRPNDHDHDHDHDRTTSLTVNYIHNSEETNYYDSVLGDVTMVEMDYATLLDLIHDQRANQPLSILNLAEPILSSQQSTQITRGSNAHDTSNSANESSEHDAHLNPAALSADLSHYQSLFSKLRFSYLEQVTKEKYLRSIVGDPPVLVSHEDNTALEDHLAVMKSELKAKKEGTNKLVEEIEELAREAATRHQDVDNKVDELETIPVEIEELQRQVDEARRKLKEKDDQMDVDGDVGDDPRLNNLGMKETEELLAEQSRRTKEIEREIEALEKDLPGKIRECERAERELEEVEQRRNQVTKSAREVKRIREEGGRDMLEERGRWYKSSEVVLNGLLGAR